MAQFLITGTNNVVGKLEDLTGKSFNYLTVVSYAHPKISPCGHRKHLWNCRCICGNNVKVTSGHLKSGHTKSCGCYHKKQARKFNRKVIQAGARFDRLKVEKFLFIKDSYDVYKCLCDCGNTTQVSSSSLRSGNTRSCGCLQRESSSITGSRVGLDNMQGASRGWYYSGVHMRSSYEIMVAEILDRYNIEWQYEPKIFKLGDGCRYQPDFYLVEYDRWIEVKGYFTDVAKTKVAKFKGLGYDIEVWRQRKIEYEYGCNNSAFIKRYRS